MSRQSERAQDFIIIVFKNSELRDSWHHGAKLGFLGTEWLKKEEHKDAYSFAESHEEVVVADYMQLEAILGSVSNVRTRIFHTAMASKVSET
jgi:hypothetical protein